MSGTVFAERNCRLEVRSSRFGVIFGTGDRVAIDIGNPRSSSYLEMPLIFKVPVRSIYWDAPEGRKILHRDMGKVFAISLAGGLHHRYEKRSA